MAPDEDVGSALQFVTSGEAQLGVVDDADAKVEPKVRIAERGRRAVPVLRERPGGGGRLRPLWLHDDGEGLSARGSIAVSRSA